MAVVSSGISLFMSALMIQFYIPGKYQYNFNQTREKGDTLYYPISQSLSAARFHSRTNKKRAADSVYYDVMYYLL